MSVDQRETAGVVKVVALFTSREPRPAASLPRGFEELLARHRLVRHALGRRPDIGTMGLRLYSTLNKIQHAAPVPPAPKAFWSAARSAAAAHGSGAVVRIVAVRRQPGEGEWTARIDSERT